MFFIDFNLSIKVVTLRNSGILSLANLCLALVSSSPSSLSLLLTQQPANSNSMQGGSMQIAEQRKKAAVFPEPVSILQLVALAPGTALTVTVDIQLQ